MHMADALLSPVVGGLFYAVSGAALLKAGMTVKRDELTESKIPLMAVSGAFVFAAQMINFTIPGTGSSGHIGGGILLAALLGGGPALLTIAAVLLIQCLFFADGGLLALGCNIFNIGVVPCLIVYPLLFRPLLKKKITKKRLTWVSILAAVLGLQLGSFSVVLETSASGITALPFGSFALVMQSIHLAIGLVEGIVTASILCFVHGVRPELLERTEARAGTAGLSLKKVVVSLLVLAVVTGGGLSLFASSHPDGLEWSIQKITGSAELESSGKVQDQAASLQAHTAILPDYDFQKGSDGAGTTVSGLIGSALTFALAGGAGLAVAAAKKRRKASQD